MDASHPVWESREMTAARAAGNLGAIVRLVRVAVGLTQIQLASRLHCSASTLSRLETGRQPLNNTATLRLLAEHLAIPPEALGLVPKTSVRHAEHASVSSPPIAARLVSVGREDSDEGEKGDDRVQRRRLLTDLAVSAGAAVAAPKLSGDPVARAAGGDNPGALLVRNLEDVLLGTGPADTEMSVPDLRTSLASVVADFQACRYGSLAHALPQLIAGAQATSRLADGNTRLHATAVLAETYNVTTRMLIKLDEEHIAWISGDRARTAAQATGNALTFAESTRNLCILTRTTGRYDKALALAVDAAQRLETGGANPDPHHLSQYGLLISTAGYCAAKAEDRSGSKELLDAAADAARRLQGVNAHWMGFGDAGVTLYRISSALVLGDAGTAIAHARTIHPAQLPTVERQARYWVDVARAFGMWGKHDDCYRALLSAEQAAPEETHSLPVVRTLVLTLAANQHRCAMPGLNDFAARCGITC